MAGDDRELIDALCIGDEAAIAVGTFLVTLFTAAEALDAAALKRRSG